MPTTNTPVQPHSLEAEKTVLGALLLDPKAIHKVADLLTADDFYDPVYKTVYEAITEVDRRSQPVDFVTVASQIEGDKKIEAIGGSAFLADLAASTSTASHVKQHAQIVLDNSQSRQVIAIGQQIAAIGYEQEQTVADQVSRAQELVLQLGSRDTKNSSQTLRELADEQYEVMADLMYGGVGDEPQRFYTGFPGLDYLFEGLRPKDLTVIAGRPGMGKTALMLSMAMNGAEKFGKKVLFMSREMSNQQNARRIISNRLGVSMKDLDRKELSDEQYRDYGKLSDQFGKLHFTFDDHPDATVSSIRARAIRYKLEHDLDVLFVDYMQLLRPPVRNNRIYSNGTEAMTEVSRSCKELARELDIPVIMGCQLNRAIETRPDKKPMMSDLRESGSIEQDSDNVLMLNRDSYYDPDPDSDASDVTQVYVRKHRQGELGMVELQFKKNTTAFCQLDRREEPAALAA